jgi:phospholipase C
MPLDHTSILKTIEKRWNLTSLTARDAAAPDIGNVLTLATPRTDDPLKSVQVPKSGKTPPGPNEPAHLQIVAAESVSHLHIPDSQGRTFHRMPILRTAKDYAQYINQRLGAWRQRRPLRNVAKPNVPHKL